MSAECIYCYQMISDETIVPSVDDDGAWHALALEHAEWCEWITTRAYRIEAGKQLLFDLICQDTMESILHCEELLRSCMLLEEWSELRMIEIDRQYSPMGA